MRWLLWGIGALLLAGCGGFSVDPVDLGIAKDDPRCTEADGELVCAHATLAFKGGAFESSTREVHFMHPTGDPPEGGFPVALLFQGSFYSAEGMWQSKEGDDFGGYHETELVRALLDKGFAVITPETRLDGGSFWDTNVVGFSSNWESSEDHALMVALFAAITEGKLGPLDEGRLFAAGISSGGYMTSRMAVSYSGKLQRLAIQSASYATCSGALCIIPDLPADHPPTLFLHGEQDLIVPIETMRDYADKLEKQGTEVKRIEDPDAGHEWLATAPAEIPEWFLAGAP
ncbi:MAG: prolyl oligopeptidase family serine peptidase [Polyangiaceae bacterium]